MMNVWVHFVASSVSPTIISYHFYSLTDSVHHQYLRRQLGQLGRPLSEAFDAKIRRGRWQRWHRNWVPSQVAMWKLFNGTLLAYARRQKKCTGNSLTVGKCGWCHHSELI